MPAESHHTFPAEFRIRRSAEFQQVFAQRRSTADHNLVMYAAPNGTSLTRVGLAVGKKIGNAVVRNHWKRLFREAFRLSREQIPTGYDLVLVPRRGVEPQLVSLQKSLVKLAARLEKAHRRESPRP